MKEAHCKLSTGLDTHIEEKVVSLPSIRFGPKQNQKFQPISGEVRL